MKSLITGIDGFIGSWLAKYLRDKGDTIIGLTRQRNRCVNTFAKKYYGDILDKELILNIIKETKPNRIFHLAAQSNILHSFSHPEETMDTNVNGTLNLLEAVRREKKETIFLSVGSSAEYGKTTNKDHFLSEDANLSPTSPYAVSKVAQGQLCQIYRDVYRLNIIHIRPFAIIGPGKKGDAISDFAQGIVAIERGEKTCLAVGNISHIRDFLDVRDVVRAMDLLSIKENCYSVYNLCLGIKHRLEDILEILISLAKTKIIVKQDPQKLRPVDDRIIVGNPERLYLLGFKPQYSLERTVTETLDYWRGRSLRLYFSESSKI